MNVFAFGETRFSISQVELADVAEVLPPVDELRCALTDIVAQRASCWRPTERARRSPNRPSAAL